MLTRLKTLLTRLTLKALLKLDPSYSRPVAMTVTPAYALEHTMQAVDKKFGRSWDSTPVPTDSIETILYRAGAKTYREQVLKEIHANSQAATPAGLRLPTA